MMNTFFKHLVCCAALMVSGQPFRAAAETGSEKAELNSSVTTTASTTWNVSTLSFTPGALSGIIFLSCQELFKDDAAKTFGTELSAMANGWKSRFGKPDPHFFYVVPSSALVPEYHAPKGIDGKKAELTSCHSFSIIELQRPRRRDAYQTCSFVPDRSGHRALCRSRLGR